MQRRKGSDAMKAYRTNPGKRLRELLEDEIDQSKRRREELTKQRREQHEEKSKCNEATPKGTPKPMKVSLREYSNTLRKQEDFEKKKRSCSQSQQQKKVGRYEPEPAPEFDHGPQLPGLQGVVQAILSRLKSESRGQAEVAVAIREVKSDQNPHKANKTKNGRKG